MSEALEEILIQCQARSREANLMFQFAALTLMRVQIRLKNPLLCD